VVALFAMYLAYTIGVVLRRMVITTEIDADILCGAGAIYFLIGVVWAMSYWLIYELEATETVIKEFVKAVRRHRERRSRSKGLFVDPRHRRHHPSQSVRANLDDAGDRNRQSLY
jgi:hypothetical protein